jgi:hypothetical protein
MRMPNADGSPVANSRRGRLERIFQRIEKDNPTVARNTVQAIYDGCAETTLPT